MKKIPPAEAINAQHDALAAVVMALADTMPAEQKARFADNLARLARNAEAKGLRTLETMLIDLFNAARR